MKVRITRQAEVDLEAIAEWIGRGNPERAISFIDELLNRCRPSPSTRTAFPSIVNFAASWSENEPQGLCDPLRASRRLH